MCKFKDCKKSPLYNKEGETKALYCFTHKLDEMLDVKHKKCIYQGCKIRPTFNKEGETKALFCLAHKTEEMIDIHSKNCIHPGCKTRPNYNKYGERNALYCLSHKLEEMIDIKHKTCIYAGCKIRPTFNKEGEKTALYCFTHKLEEMIDILDKTCIHPGCKIRPNYNLESEKTALYCTSHKLEGMINILSKTCIHQGCKTIPNFNKNGETNALYCFTHKFEGMVDIKSKTCKTHLCSTQIGKKYDGYCLFCYMNMFPDKPVSRNYKTKEYSVVEYVKTKYPNLTWVSDKIIQNGCSKRRPDLLLDLGYQIVIIEVDENQHIDYDCSCENKRIMELSQDLGHRPIVFIRFNPDEYHNKENIISSCWGQNTKGICVVKKNKKNEWTERLNALSLQIDYWIELPNKTNKTIETIQLFYDS